MRYSLIKVLLFAGLAAMHISAANTIPPAIDLVDFSISTKEKKVIISWATKLEQDVNNYYIERAINDGEFKRLGTVRSKGNSTELRQYSFRDQFSEGFTGKAHYRLMLQDDKGHCSRSIKQSIILR